MRAVLAPEALEAIVEALRRRGWRVVAPTVRDKAIVLDEIASAAELPIGWKDVQAPGSYKLERRDDEARFGYAVGPQSWKGELLAPSVRLLKIERKNGGFKAAKDAAVTERTAFFGVRPCEVAAIKIQDRVLVGGPYVDEDYLARRKASFIIAVNCGEPAANCFCASMGTGPKAEDGYDLVLTEVLDGTHRFVAEAGTDEGAEFLNELPHAEAGDADAAAAEKVTDDAREQMGITLDTSDVRELLQANYEHPRYDDVSARCLQCTNCTLACPTCFCTTVDDVNDLSGESGERVRKWDSCFTLQYSEMHGGGTRRTPQSRYRQWLTHKLVDLARPVRHAGLRRLRPVHHLVSGGNRYSRRSGSYPRESGGSTMKTLDAVIAESPIFAGLTQAQLEFITGCAQNVHFEAGEKIAEAGDQADVFYLVRMGEVALDLDVPNKKPLRIDTVEAGQALGWSWLIPPYEWKYDVTATELVRAVAFDGACLRGKCDDDPVLGYELLRRFSQVIVGRLQATRLRLLDIYGTDAN